MDRTRFLRLAAAALCSLFGCRAGTPPERNTPPALELRIVFRLPGDDFGGTEELRERDRVGRAVEAGGAGRVVGSENGMGFMALRVEPADPAGAEERLRMAVASARPSLRCEVTRR